MSGVIKTVLKNMLVPCLLVYAPFASAEWRIQPELSKLSYLTSKASAATEINHFRLVDGVITEKGTASLTISLNSVDTGVEIRDERMRNIVFETERFPVANVTAEVDISLYEEMADGETQTATLDTNIGLHGMIVTLPVEFRITKLTNSRLLVHNVEPVVISAVTFGLSEAVAELQKLAGLSAINPNVVVNFELIFMK